ncbi:hypothetical protein KO02_06000 [Sphingobacterium sp. ML3W]|nr:hypothetical protein KO02_06000 [Sphingobacterium sp. ML3W]
MGEASSKNKAIYFAHFFVAYSFCLSKLTKSYKQQKPNFALGFVFCWRRARDYSMNPKWGRLHQKIKPFTSLIFLLLIAFV